ncbi:MAG: hypothetical protein Ct9H300mP18_14480 [Candidatus Neomarinimicrobiota bacterium]|nr:MAG: hypothetical protein Ct9H300mP18_14480 [Candidatus Neomarinimicrobiota bacterium]
MENFSHFVLHGSTFAGFSSLNSKLELAGRNLRDMGVERKTAVGWIVGVCFIMGIPSAGT